MTANDIREHFKARAPWVDWEGRTSDHFLHGDPRAEVTGIAVGWIATLEMARQAAEAGANLFVTHEPIFYDGYWSMVPEKPRLEADRAEKAAELDRLGLTVLRCHDTWDRFPRVGIPDAWAAFLGFTDYARDTQDFYGVARLAPVTVGALARQVLERVRPLGQPHVEVFLPERTITNIAIGTGAITCLSDMREQAPADCYLVTNDGTNTWTAELHAIDWQVPMIRVDHATAELPGMLAMADYLATQFPEIQVRYIPYACPYEVMV